MGGRVFAGDETRCLPLSLGRRPMTHYLAAYGIDICLLGCAACRIMTGIQARDPAGAC